jgi:probable F420-dependent oxidoreductase
VKPDAAGIGRLGLWFFTELMPAAQAGEFASRIEALGYGTLWMPEATGRNPLVHASYLLTQTQTLNIATGVCSIYHRHPAMAVQSINALAEQSGGRFVFGVGVSHAPFVEGVRGVPYGKPVASMRRYLEDMAKTQYGALPPADRPPVVLAALGPKMLALSAELADGAHPYWTTPEHTAQAREIMGPDKLLCVEQKVILSTNAEQARTAARQVLSIYTPYPNYTNNWKRLGFGDDDLRDGGSDRLVDALVAWGDEKVIADRVQAHLDAGANHVCIQPIRPDGAFGQPDWDLLEALAPARS